MPINDRLTHLAEILIALAATPVPSQQFQVLADRSASVLPADFLAVCLRDPDREGYRVHALFGAAGNAIPGRRFALTEGLAGLVLRTGRTSLSDDVATHPSATPDVEGVGQRLGWRAALVLPLRQGETTIGALYFAGQPPVIYNLEDMQVGNLLAAGLSASLEMARLYQTLSDERGVLAAVLASTKDGIIVVNPDETILLANPASGGMLDLDDERVAGQPLHDVLHDASLLEMVREQNTERTIDLALPDGRLAQCGLVQVQTPFGERVGSALVIRDVTVLQQLAQMKNEFVETVSHDLKNPISSVSLAVDLLEQSGPLNAEQAESATIIRETASHMAELVHDLLDLGRIEAGLDLVREPVDMALLATEIAEDLVGQAQARGVNLSIEAEAVEPVFGDPARLRQVLVNLLDNAIKYTPKDGRVKITVQAGRGEVITRVIDTGYGIPTASLPHIFDKFYRVRTEATAGIQGTGLGLAIARSIVEAHDGRLWAESHEGKGSSFSFALPARGG